LIVDWASILSNPTKAKIVIGKNFVLHKRGITKDEDAIKADFASGNYFQAGVDSADIMTLLLGPVQ